MKQRHLAWVVGLVTLITMTYAFIWFGSLTEMMGGSGLVTNALVIGLFFAAHAMEKVDPTGE